MYTRVFSSRFRSSQRNKRSTPPQLNDDAAQSKKIKLPSPRSSVSNSSKASCNSRGRGRCNRQEKASHSGHKEVDSSDSVDSDDDEEINNHEDSKETKVSSSTIC